MLAGWRHTRDLSVKLTAGFFNKHLSIFASCTHDISVFNPDGEEEDGEEDKDVIKRSSVHGYGEDTADMCSTSWQCVAWWISIHFPI